MLANRPRDTKSFLTSTHFAYMWRQTLQIIRTNFPGRISPQTQDCGSRLVTVTNKPVPRSSITSFAFSQAKHCFFSTTWKYWQLPIWLKTLNPKGYAAKYRYRKGLGEYALMNGNEPNTRSKNLFCIKWKQQC